jgi:hypothetical protein
MNAAQSVSATFVQINYQLSVTTAGHGVVGSAPAGIDCGDGFRLCAASFPAGTTVQVEVFPDSGWRFGGWGGACSGVGACIVAMNAAQSVFATFVQEPQQLSVTVVGHGVVGSSPAGIDCGDGFRPCIATFPAGTLVQVERFPADGWRFVSWGGACSGNGVCVVEMNAARSVAAEFKRRPFGSETSGDLMEEAKTR